MAKHYNVRVTVEEVTEATEEVDKYGNVKSRADKQILEFVNFKTQRSTMGSAAKAAIGAINLAMDEESK